MRCFLLTVTSFLSLVLAQAVTTTLTLPVVSKDGTKIYADAAGNKNGPHLIFAHGLACSTTAFDPLFNDKSLLAAFYMVRFDTRGHGFTGKPTTADFYTSDRYADDVKAVISAFKLVKPFFVGWSLGGAIAADIAAAFPHPIPFSGLVWIAGLPFYEAIPKVATPEVLSFLPGIQSTTDATLALQSRIDFVETLSAHTNDVPLAIKTSWVGSAVYLPPVPASFALGRTQNQTRLLEEAKAGWPLLIIHGSVDRQINGSVVINSMTPLFKNVESHLLQGVGHIPFFDDEPTVAKYLAAFVSRVMKTKPYP